MATALAAGCGGGGGGSSTPDPDPGAGGDPGGGDPGTGGTDPGTGGEPGGGNEPVNAVPTAQADTAVTRPSTPVVILVLQNDSDSDGSLDPASVSITTPPTRGSIVEVRPSGEVVYQPATGATGADSFSYSVADDAGAASAPASVSVDIAALPSLPLVQAAANGLVVVEAENFDANSAGADHGWWLVPDSGASNGAVVVAAPNDGTSYATGYVEVSPRLDFQVNFRRTGRHYVWIRGLGGADGDDSLHVGLDGVASPSSDHISYFASELGWSRDTMDGIVASVDVSRTGIHTLNVWMREDGMVVDKILLTTDAQFVPAGEGPDESARDAASVVPALAGDLAAMPDSVDLTQEGVTDWMHWGNPDKSAVNRKAGVAAQISTTGVIGDQLPGRFTPGSSPLVRWTDGTSIPTEAGFRGGISVTGLGNGFQFSAPAGGQARTLTVFLAATQSKGRFEATLSDGSAEPYVAFVDSPAGSLSQAVTLRYQAAGHGALINIRYVLDEPYTAGGTVALLGAALVDAGRRPQVAEPSIQPPGAFFAASVDVTLTSATPGATIRYTTDGRDPAQGDAYTGPFALTAGAELRVQAFVDGFEPSGTSAASFSRAACGTHRIMPLGDSITLGTGTVDSEGDFVGYRRQLFSSLVTAGYQPDFVGSQDDGKVATGPTFDTQHEGHGGWKIEQVADNVRGWLSANPADTVLLHIGTNNTGAPGIYTDLRELDRLLTEIDRFDPKTHVVLARIINQSTPRTEIKTFNFNVSALVSARQLIGDRVTLVDMESALTYPDDMDDSLHPNIAGYNKMAAVWGSALKSVMPVCLP